MSGSAPTIHALPLPRRPLETEPESAPAPTADPYARARLWYENDLEWATVPGRPLRLRTGVRFDVLDVPAEAGAGALRHLAPGSPVALRGDRMRLLVAAGSAEELPGLLEWLEWSAVALDLRVLGAGDTMEAPLAPSAAPAPATRWEGGGLGAPGAAGVPAALGVPAAVGVPAAPGAGVTAPRDGSVQGAAVWLRPPGPGCEFEASLPALSAVGREGSAPDLVRLVDTVAARCHRARLRRVCAGPPAHRRGRPQAPSWASRNQPLAFS